MANEVVDPPRSDELRDNEIIDELIRIGYDRRRDVISDQYYDEVKALINFVPQIRTSNPSFRPKINFPDLQLMAFQEANDLTDQVPLIYIAYHEDGLVSPEQIKQRERGLRALWQAGDFNYEIMMAVIHAIFSGTSFLFPLFRPELYSGRGGIDLNWFTGENVIVDPWCTSSKNWQYVILRIRMTYDEIYTRFPKAAGRVRPEVGITPSPVNLMGRGQPGTGASGTNIDLPPGAMRTVQVTGLGRGAPAGAPIVDFCFLRDATRKLVEQDEPADGSPFPEPATVPAYPTGRLIVRCDKYKLFDGQNPFRRFPLIPVYGMPPAAGFWAPPPVRYVLMFQQLAETTTSQIIENMIRMNNGMMVINKSTGLNKDKIRGIPAEIIEVDGIDGQKGVNILTPPPFSAEMLGIPNALLQHMRQAFGFSEARSGQAGEGNISANLFETMVAQAQGMTRQRAKLLVRSINQLALTCYEMMLDYLGNTQFPLVEAGSMELVPWEGALPDEMSGFSIMVDPASMRPVSLAARAKLVPLLRNMGMIDIEHALKWLEVPEAKEITGALAKEAALNTIQNEAKRVARGRRA